MDRVYVIIAWYNGIKWVDKCLSSLMSSSCNPEVVIVDNGSTDGSQALIKKQFPKVKLIQSETNLGFGKANNIGINYAMHCNADYVFLLNQDAWVEYDSIEKLMNLALLNADYGIISPIHLNGSNTALDLNFSRNIVPDSCPGFYSDMYLNKFKDIYEVKNINAAAWLITKACIQKVGFFEPLFQLYGEDDNYVQRMNFHDFKLGVTPLAVIFHDREERKGQLNTSGINKKVEINRLTLILNINHSYLKSYAFVIQYAAYLLFKGLITKSFLTVLDPILKVNFYSKIRSKHKELC